MATPHPVVVIAGSLRKESFTLKIANALAKLAPATLKLEVVTPHGLSFFNQDLEAAPPADWLAFRDKLQKSNGVLFVTPEYNRSIPGVFWVNRLPGTSAFRTLSSLCPPADRGARRSTFSLPERIAFSISRCRLKAARMLSRACLPFGSTMPR